MVKYSIDTLWISHEKLHKIRKDRNANLNLILRTMKKRICIYPQDVQIITGKSERYGRKVIKSIKDNLNKQKHQLVTIEEFCEYMGLEVDRVEALIV